MAAEQATYSSATTGRGFSADVSARSAPGRLTYLQADFLSHLFVNRQLSLPVVLKIGTAVLSALETHGRQEASYSKVFTMERPRAAVLTPKETPISLCAM